MRAFFRPRKISTAAFSWLAAGSRDAYTIPTARRLSSASAVYSSLQLSRKLPEEASKATQQPFKEFDLRGKVFVVTGGARGLGLAMAEALVEAGGKGAWKTSLKLFSIIDIDTISRLVHCLDRLEAPDDEFALAQSRACGDFGGSLHYSRMDVRDVESLNGTISRIAAEDSRLDGLIAAAGVQQIKPATEYTMDEISEVLAINYSGVFLSATAVAREMKNYKCRGSILLVASMSGFVANKGLISPVYNSSKAAVIQLGRSLAMEWGKIEEDGSGGIRVNSLCPGHIETPMVKKNFEDDPALKKTWLRENMLGRLSKPEEFRGAGLFLLSEASSFMTGATLVIDGGHTAW
jgi:NAD(P)-dependent dehydrogenase (short-subunit alcohol dehydrogenase family)